MKTILLIKESFESIGNYIVPKSRIGSAFAMVIGVVAFIAVAVAIAIGYIVLVSTVNAAQTASTGLSSVQSVNLLSIGTSVTGAFLLLTVLPVVLAASLIIGALFLFMQFGRGGGGGGGEM